MNNTNNKDSRFKKNLLSTAVSTAIIPLVLATSLSAFAAEQDKSSEQAKNTEEEQIEVIQVTGILGSLEASARIKRYADTVVDVITSEDIGQFSDDSIAGAIQRIPGVQIETDDAGTDGDRVSIRGLGPGFVNSTINGRRLLSSGTEGRNLRNMNFNAFPPNVLSGVRVTKGATASRPESGLAGQVNLETLKPLELNKLKKKNTYTSIGLRADLNDISDGLGSRINFLTAYRNDDNDFGGYISLVAADEDKARDQMRNNWQDNAEVKQDFDGDGAGDVDLRDLDGDGIAEEQFTARAPTTISMNPIRETPKRLAFAMGFQYQPNEDIDINWDIMFSHYNKESTRDQFQFSINRNSVWGKTVFNNSEAGNPGLAIDENNAVRYANFANATDVGAISARTTSQIFDNKTENMVSGLNVDWAINDGFTANFDVYVSTLDYEQDLRFIRFQKDLNPDTFIYDGTGNLPVIIAPDADIILAPFDSENATADQIAANENVDRWEFSRASIRQIATEGENYGATAAFEYDIDDGVFFSSVFFGFHFDRTDIDGRRTGNGSRVTFLDENGHILKDDNGDVITNEGASSIHFDDLDNPNIGIDGNIDANAIKAAAFQGSRLDGAFLSGSGFLPESYLIPNFDAAAAVDPRLATYGWDELGVDPLASYKMTEDIYALYTQVNVDTEIFGLPMTGNFGMRAVFTDNKATALQVTEINGEESEAFLTTSNEYWKYLPSLNLNFALNENMSLRVGISRAISRPDYQSTAPINRVTLADDADDSINEARVGNPNLKPESSENLDITFEWYTQYDGAFVLSGFYKEIKDFIVNGEITGDLEGFDEPFRLTTPINFSDGTAEGFEIGLLQPLGKLFPALDGLGFSTNYTYVDSSFEGDPGDAGFGFPGSSKDNFNFTGFYEADLYTIRLAYTYRSSFFRSLGGTGSQGSSSRFSGDQEKLNLSLKLKLVKNLSLKLSANNITGEKRRDFYGEESTFLDYFDRGRTYSVTVGYKF